MLHRRQPLRTVRAVPAPSRRNVLIQRAVSARSSLRDVEPYTFYLDATLYGGRMTYDVPITPIE